MKFLLIYNQGNVPADKVDEDVAQLWQWINNLKESGAEVSRFVVNDIAEGVSIESSGSSPYEGKVFGISVVEAESLDDVLALVKDWPELKYGGRLDVIPELNQ